MTLQADAGSYTIDWDSLAYPANTLAPAAPNFVLTDQYGYQVRMALTHPTTNYAGIDNPAEDTVYLGGLNDIFFGNDPPQGSGGFGENTKTATMNIYLTGTTTNVAVNGLNFLVTDIDPLDANTLTDRCDFVTMTGNNGNPALSYVNGAPTGNGTNATYIIGPSTGTGTSGTNANSRTIFTATGGGTARTNLNFAANQAHCLYYTNTTSTTSDNNNLGSLRATYPNGTSRATVAYDEVIENALGSSTPTNQNASGRGVGMWGNGSFSIASSIALDKQTTTTSFMSVGEVINYTYIVTNVGPVPMNSGQNIQINDTKIGLFSCPAIPAAGIAVGATHTCTASYTVTAADVTAGQVSNTATAGVGTGTQAFASRLQSNSDIVVVPRVTTLTLVKSMTNDHGGTATTGAFTLSAAGPTNISGVSGAASVTNAIVIAGSYNLSETNLPGYAAGSWSCTQGALTGSLLVLTSGQDAVCTINNNDIAPQLTLVKTVTNNNGGTLATSNFTLSATGPTSISGVSGAAAVTSAVVTAGTYVLSETNDAGYAAGSWSCNAGTLSGSSLVIGIGQLVTCSINNDDIGPVLTLVKTVTNDNGGTATTADFTLNAVGPVNLSGVSGAASVTNVTVSAGSYALSETALQGYAAGAWSCSAGTLSGSNLTLALGQTATCTINNNDIAPLLTLVKTVTNDHGGTATTADFPLSATGPTNITGISGAVSVTNASVNAGTYSLSETNVAGYAAGAWSCSSGILTGSSLVLSVGQTATCTINNNDIAAVLTLVKTVTDTSGGPSTVSSFTLTATGPTTVSGVTGAPAVTSAAVAAGTYALSEAGPSGYTAGGWSCTSGTLTGSSLGLSLGQTATCTINNVKLPTLTIRKISNGGTGSFGFSAGNGFGSQNILTTTAGSTFTGTTVTLAAHDTITTITETMPAAFWQIQAATCTGMGAGGTATLAGNALTLNVAATSAGRNIICTFTNRRRPTVSVQKITTGAFGGAFSFADTNLTGTVANISTAATNTATPAVPTRLIATATGTAVTLTETSPLAFVIAGTTCTDANSAVSGNTNPVATSATAAVNIAAAAVRVGADINCVFTNAQAMPQLALTKTPSVPTVSSAGTTVNYTIAVNNSGNTTLANISVTDPLGTVVCPSSGAATVTTLGPGVTENCTLSYSVPQSVFDTNGGGDADLDNTATASATYNSASVSANGSATVGLVITPALAIEKIPNTSAPVNAGNTIGYTYRVTNTGNVTMNNVTINDAHVGYGTAPVPGNEVIYSDAAPLGNSSDAGSNASWDVLAPGDVIEFTSNYIVVQADIDNLQ